MSEGMPITDLLKSSPEVTSLATTDRILAIDSNGEPKKISRSNTVNQDKQMKFTVTAGDERWIRVAKMTEYGSCCIMTVAATGFNGGWGYPLIFALNAPHGGSSSTIRIIPLNPGLHNTTCYWSVPKIRISGNEANKYIDVYVPTRSSIRVLNIHLSNAVGCSLVDPVEDPTTYANVKEFDVASLWGG